MVSGNLSRKSGTVTLSDKYALAGKIILCLIVQY